MSTTTASRTRSLNRWAGAVLITAVLVDLIAEAIVAGAWDRRPYSYVDDYVNFLGSPFSGDFRGILISSPLWWLMSIAWVLAGALVATATFGLSRRLTGWRRRALPTLGAAQAIALVLFAVFPLGPARINDGTLPLYLIGAFLSIIAGNALAIVTALARRPLGLPRWLAVISVTLGAAGLLNIPLTYGWVPTGLAERISLYSYLLWALTTGVALTVARSGAVDDRRARPAYLAPTNTTFKMLTRMGISLGVVKVLTVPGRTTGRPRSTPVSPVPLDGRRYIIAPIPQGDWARNARAAGRGQLTGGRRTEQILLRELDHVQEADLRRRVMAAFPVAVPHGVRMIKALGLVTGADPAEFAAAADRVTAFEVLPARP